MTESNFSGISQVLASGCRYFLSEASQGDTGLGAGPGDNRFTWQLSNARHHRTLENRSSADIRQTACFLLIYAEIRSHTATEQPESSLGYSKNRPPRRLTSLMSHAAVIQIRNRLVPWGTVGGRIAPTRKPAPAILQPVFGSIPASHLGWEQLVRSLPTTTAPTSAL